MSDVRQSSTGPRASTIVWGVTLLVVAALALAVRYFEAWDLPGFSPMVIVVGIGALLVLISLAGGLVALARRNRREQGRGSEDQPTG